MAAPGTYEAPLQVVCCRPLDLGNRWLDPTGGNRLAGVSPFELSFPTWVRRLSSEYLLSAPWAIGGLHRRPIATPQDIDSDRYRLGWALFGFDGDGSSRRDECHRLSFNRIIDRHGECLRNAGAPDTHSR